MSRPRLPVAILGVIALVALPRPVAGHVDYVVPEGDDVGSALSFVLETLLDPVHAVLVIGGGLALVAATITYLGVRPVTSDVAAFRDSMADYRELVPWLLRICIGFPLVGAGFSGYLFSPAVPVDLRLAQVAIGFLLLFGLATRLVALAGIALYLLALAVYPGVVLANEFVTGFVAIALLGPGHPSADDVLGDVAATPGTVFGRLDPVYRRASSARRQLYATYAPTVIRVGLGLNFLYLGITQKLLDPGRAMAVVTKYDLAGVVPVDPALWVVGAGLAEAGLGVLLVVGLFSRGAAIAALSVFTLTLFALPDDPVLAHLSLFGLASSVLITGSGPFGLDRRLAALTAAEPTDSEQPAPT